MYPLQISPKAQIEWGYVQPSDESETTMSNADDDADANSDGTTTTTSTRNQNWVTVDKSVLDTILIKGIEKQMGFVGTPDPTTGFYCVSRSVSPGETFFFVCDIHCRGSLVFITT